MHTTVIRRQRLSSMESSSRQLKKSAFVESSTGRVFHPYRLSIASRKQVLLFDVSHVAVNSDPKANMLQKLGFVLKKRPELSKIFERLSGDVSATRLKTNLQRHFSTRLNAKIERVEHHLAHLASAYYVGPFDRAVAVSVDGFGDFSSAAWGLASNGDIDIYGRVHFPHSLGEFYPGNDSVYRFSLLRR